MTEQKIALVVDDDPLIVDSLEFILTEELQYFVHTATVPERAVELAQLYAVDLLVLDVHMPNLDGFEVLKLVRDKQPDVKVLMVTGVYEQYRDRFQDQKIDKVIQKPVEPKMLVETILEIAGSSSLGEADESDKRIPNAKILLVGKDPVLCEGLKETILNDDPNDYQIKVVNSDQEALSQNSEFKPDILFCDMNLPGNKKDI